MLWVLNEPVLLSTQNICLNWWIRKQTKFYAKSVCLSGLCWYTNFLLFLFQQTIYQHYSPGSDRSLCWLFIDTNLQIITFRSIVSILSTILTFISYLSYYLHCCMLPDNRCLSHGMCLYQVMMTLHFWNDFANDTESIQKLKITSFSLV